MIVRYPKRFMRWFFDYYKHEYGVEIIADKIKRNKKPIYIVQELGARRRQVNYKEEALKLQGSLMVMRINGVNRYK